jgi:hypothetical protein
MAAGKAPQPEAGGGADEGQGVGPFVINLCSSTTPMALSSPDLPEMKRFSFFVSRRREDNRERFRLHMGYFSTLAEAEEWLAVVRDIYPGAWAGEAPGKKLRARAAAAAAANNLPPPPTAAPPRVVSVSAPSPAATARPAAAAAPSTPPNIVVPTLHAAPPVASPAPAAASASAKNSASALMQPVLASVPRPVAQPAPPRAAALTAAARSGQPARAASAPAARGAQPAPAQSRQLAKPAVPKKQPPVPPALAGSNVREVMAALDETGETREMRVPPYQTSAPSVARASTSPASAAPGVSGMRASGSATAGHRAPVQVTEQPRTKAPISQRPPVQASDSSAALTDTQVLRFLEQRREDGTARGDDDANSGISLLKPDDTQTRLALKDAVRDNAPVSFAVQLQWSVSPIQLDQVPPLAIFSAYTLYTVEGSREGRKWYGLRLGFFSDAISAKQVAYYVRSEFASVAVVPVSPQEKQRAGAEENKATTGRFAKPQVPQPKVEEFKLFDDDKSVVQEPPRPPAKPAVPKAAAKAAPPKKNKPLGKVRAKEQRSPKTLEETLEILGASDLEIDNGRGELLNDTGVRHLRVQVQKNTPFAKLLDRLSERVRRS